MKAKANYKPFLFHDEISERLRELNDGDKIIIQDGETEKHITCRESARFEDGLVESYRRFESSKGKVVPNIVDYLYEESEEGKHLFIIKDNERQEF